MQHPDILSTTLHFVKKTNKPQTNNPQTTTKKTHLALQSHCAQQEENTSLRGDVDLKLSSVSLCISRLSPRRFKDSQQILKPHLLQMR